MAKHNIYVNLPWSELSNSDALLDIYTNNQKVGTITISKGAFEWYPKNARRPYRLTWRQFDAAIKKYFEK